MSSAAPYNHEARWSWAGLADQELPRQQSGFFPGSFSEEPQVLPSQHATSADSMEPNDERESAGGSSPPEPQKHYPPRTCRICLEEVMPSTDIPMEGLASMFNPTPKVSYLSADPSSGRLIRPCKCRGSQKYVHEGCLQEWRHADPRYGKRNFWECPTCKFKYRLERIKWGRYISSTLTQVMLTIVIMTSTIFIFGFIADPIINLYLDPYDTITSTATGGRLPTLHADEDSTWAEHFLKGVASLGLLGFVKVFFAMSPWHWWNLRQSGIIGGGGRRGGTGRERLENLSWTVIIIGVITFLYAVWSWVRAWTRRTLEKAGERVADVQGDDEDEEFDIHPASKMPTGGLSDSSHPRTAGTSTSKDTSTASGSESKRTQ